MPNRGGGNAGGGGPKSSSSSGGFNRSDWPCLNQINQATYRPQPNSSDEMEVQTTYSYQPQTSLFQNSQTNSNTPVSVGQLLLNGKYSMSSKNRREPSNNIPSPQDLKRQRQKDSASIAPIIFFQIDKKYLNKKHEEDKQLILENSTLFPNLRKLDLGDDNSKKHILIVRGASSDGLNEYTDYFEEIGIKSVLSIKNKSGELSKISKVEFNSFDIYKRLLISGHLQIGSYSYKVEKVAGQPVRCSRCKKFGHNKCEGPVICGKCCSKDHLDSDCPQNNLEKKNLKCANCSQNHSSYYKGCQIYKNNYKLIVEKSKEKNQLNVPNRSITQPIPSSYQRNYSTIVSNSNDQILSKLEKILNDINDKHSDLEGKFENLNTSNSELISEISKLNVRIDETNKVLIDNNIKIVYFILDFFRYFSTQNKPNPDAAHLINTIFKTHKLENLEKNFSPLNYPLTIVHWNSNSLRNKIISFEHFLSQYSPDIVSINETKCNEVTANNELIFHNYITLHKGRSNSKNGGGGVCLLIKKSIKFIQVNEFDYLNLELVAIKIRYETKDLLIISYYNPPQFELNYELFTKLNQTNFVLCGDLNSKNISFGCNSNNKNGQILVALNQLNNVINLNKDQFTYQSFSTNKEEILDYIICSTEMFNFFDNLEVLKENKMGSNHFPMVANFKSNLFQKINVKKSYSLNFKKANWPLFQRLLPKNSPEPLFDDINKFNEFIVNSLLKAAEEAIPKKSNNPKPDNLPDYIVELIKIKNKVKRKNESERKKYNVIKKLIQDEINAVKNKRWLDLVNSQGNKIISSRPFWKKIQKINNPEKVTKSQIPTLIFNEKVFTSDLEKAKLFGKILEKTFSDSNEDSFDKNFKITVDSFISQKEFFITGFDPFTISELNTQLKKLNRGSAAGHDKIHNLLLLNSSIEFKNIILDLINQSVNQSTLPDSWKSATITMIPKKKHRSPDPKDYRPISLTSCLAKLAEKLVYSRISNFLKSNNIIITQQSGFRQKRQTKDNLVHLLQKSIEQFNRRRKICAIFFDIASAFDKVWHNGLIYKL
ncbi:unnamed protein product, partial [Brachionus calyciflorus]